MNGNSFTAPAAAPASPFTGTEADTSAQQVKKILRALRLTPDWPGSGGQRAPAAPVLRVELPEAVVYITRIDSREAVFEFLGTADVAFSMAQKRCGLLRRHRSRRLAEMQRAFHDSSPKAVDHGLSPDALTGAADWDVVVGTDPRDHLALAVALAATVAECLPHARQPVELSALHCGLPPMLAALAAAARAPIPSVLSVTEAGHG